MEKVMKRRLGAHCKLLFNSHEAKNVTDWTTDGGSNVGEFDGRGDEFVTVLPGSKNLTLSGTVYVDPDDESYVALRSAKTGNTLISVECYDGDSTAYPGIPADTLIKGDFEVVDWSRAEGKNDPVAYSVSLRPSARATTPVTWSEVLNQS